jgi:hypothetical protein
MDAKASMAGVVANALGDTRIQELTTLARRVEDLQILAADADTVDILLVPLKERDVARWRAMAAQHGENWVYVASSDESIVLALDEPSEAGMRDHAAAVIYPELHTRLVSWWLVHAWRSIDLLEDTLGSLWRWRIASGAVTARAVIEEAGALVDEAQKLANAWSIGKATSADALKRPAAVREALAPVLLHAGMGSRLKGSNENLQATNVLTLVWKLTRTSGNPHFSEWYDWLSDAAHPAFGARIAYASVPMVHGSGAVTVRAYARAPLSLQHNSQRQEIEPRLLSLSQTP